MICCKRFVTITYLFKLMSHKEIILNVSLEIDCGPPAQHDLSTVVWNLTKVKSEAVYTCFDNSSVVVECTDEGWNYPSHISDQGRNKHNNHPEEYYG